MFNLFTKLKALYNKRLRRRGYDFALNSIRTRECNILDLEHIVQRAKDNNKYSHFDKGIEDYIYYWYNSWK